jgi:hypothetical protein
MSCGPILFYAVFGAFGVGIIVCGAIILYGYHRG